jgi:hypothetical protein
MLMLKKMLRYILSFVFLLSLLFVVSIADEGMWLLDSIHQLPIDSLKDQGLRLDPKQIYNPEGGGIAEAVVRVNGGTGSFVSPEGLIITNHHVAFTAVQRQSTPAHNYLEDGFYARSREDELPAIGYDVLVLDAFRDVTPEVLGSIDEKMSDLDRYEAIENISKRIVREAEEGKDVKCEVKSFYGGSRYYLFTYFNIRDVRLVYVPPRSIGDFGGEIDNWMWPRHAGDFAFLRAYVSPEGKSAGYSEENLPYNSRAYLKLSSSGVKGGDLVMLIGFPGTTRRYESSFSINKMVNHDYPLDIQTRREVISILEKASAEDSSVAIRLSSRIKGLNNYLKKNRGMLEGFERAKILKRKIEEEKSLEEFLKQNPKLGTEYRHVLAQLDSLSRERKKIQDKELLLDWMTRRCDFLKFASTIYKWSLEKEKEDQDRELGYQDRDTLETKERLIDAQVNLVPSADKRIFVYFLKKAHSLPSEQKIRAVEKILEGIAEEDKDDILEEFAHDLYEQTELGSAEERLKMFDMSEEELIRQRDSFIDFAADLEVEREELRKKKKEFSGALTRLEPKLIQAYVDWENKKLYPDANRTMRFNYGEVKGYSPRDAVSFSHITTLTGIMEKDTGREPFDVPRELEKTYFKNDFGPYLDSSVGNVPANFLSTNDVTNGNSGSPVMNGRGELVGLVFDGNYESISADYLFEPELTRCINVDIRYVLFLLDRVYHIENLLKELSIH